MSCFHSGIPRSRLLGVIALLVLAMAASVACGQQVIVNTDVNDDSLSLNGLRAIFFMRMAQWPSDGRPIKVFVFADRDPLHVKFSKNQLGVFPRQLRRSWDRLVFSGIGQSPIEVENEEQMRKRVSSTPGAIGYVNEVKDDDNVRPLAVE